MSEAIVAAFNVTMGVVFPDDAGTGAQWQIARGHFGDVKGDGFAWSSLEDPRNFGAAVQRRFVLIRFPGVSVGRIQRYLTAQRDAKNQPIRGRLWQIQWNSLPAGVRTILFNTGVLTIGSVAQGGDFTWAQVQAFVVNLATGLGDTDDLSGNS